MLSPTVADFISTSDSTLDTSVTNIPLNSSQDINTYISTKESRGETYFDSTMDTTDTSKISSNTNENNNNIILDNYYNCIVHRCLWKTTFCIKTCH